MTVGTVAEIWRYPVKSMGGERVGRAAVGAAGVLGDRAFAVVDDEDGAVATAKVLRPWAQLCEFSARFSAEPEPGTPLPPVMIRFPDGSALRSDDVILDTALSEVLGRAVTLRTGGPFVDLAAAHILTSASLAGAAEARGGDLDVRRFRPNLLLDVAHEATGFPEDTWLDHRVALGADAVLAPFLPTPRCVMTTLAQPGLPADKRVLSTLTRHHRLPAGEYGVRPCLGVYADVVAEGVVREGDAWQLASGR